MQPGNILRINTLDEDWSDKDIVILHACFQLLTDCIEKEKLHELTDWTQNESQKLAKKEIDTLYAWWQNRIILEKEKQFDTIWSENQYEEDTEMIMRLVRIRKYLWT